MVSNGHLFLGKDVVPSLHASTYYRLCFKYRKYFPVFIVIV